MCAGGSLSQEPNNPTDLATAPHALAVPDTTGRAPTFDFATGATQVWTKDSLNERLSRVCKSLGTPDQVVSAGIATRVANIVCLAGSTEKPEALMEALGMVEQLEPTNTTEAVLASHMVGLHQAAMVFLKRSLVCEQSTEAIDANVMRTTKLMRLFNECTDTMQRLKGKSGQQRVTVEHVHVHEGGQAIVGEVNSNRGPARGDQGI